MLTRRETPERATAEEKRLYSGKMVQHGSLEGCEIVAGGRSEAQTTGFKRVNDSTLKGGTLFLKFSRWPALRFSFAQKVLRPSPQLSGRLKIAQRFITGMARMRDGVRETDD